MIALRCLSLSACIVSLVSCATESSKATDGPETQGSSVEQVRASQDIRLSNWPINEDGSQRELAEKAVVDLEKARVVEFEKANQLLSIDESACARHSGNACGFITSFTDPFCAADAPNPCEIEKALREKISDNKTKFARAKEINQSNLGYRKIRDAEAREEAGFKAKQSKDLALSQSSEGIKQRACEAASAITLSDQIIAHEKEVSAETGVINKDALYQAGQMKVANKRQLERIEADYLRKTGSVLSLSGCKTARPD